MKSSGFCVFFALFPFFFCLWRAGWHFAEDRKRETLTGREEKRFFLKRERERKRERESAGATKKKRKGRKMTTSRVCRVPSSSIVGSALGPKQSLVVTAENDGVLLYKTSSSFDGVNEHFEEGGRNDDDDNFFRSWRASQNASVKFAHPCVYDAITKTYFGCTITTTAKKKQAGGGGGGGNSAQGLTMILSWRDDQTNYHASIDDAAAGGKTSFENKTAAFFASIDGGCVVVDGEKGNLHVVDSEGAIVGTVEAKDENDDDDEEEEKEEDATATRTRAKNNKKNETVKTSIAVEAASGNAESDDVIVVLASMMGKEVVKREIVRYTVKELDVPDDQLREGNIVDQSLLSGRKLMERVSKEKVVRVNLDESDAMAKYSTMKSSKVVKVSFDDKHFCLLWSNGAWTSHELGDGTLVRDRLFDGLQIDREDEADASGKKGTKRKAATTKENDGLAFDYISIGGGYYAVGAKIKSEGKNSANNNVAVAIIDKLYGVIHSFIEIPDSETTSIVSLAAFGGDLYVSLSDRIYSVSLELEELCLRVCMAALQKDVFGKARNEKAEAAERAFSTSGFEAATKPQCKAITLPVWKELPPERNFEGACNDIDMVWDQEKMRKQEKVAEDFIATLESGTEKQMLKSLEIFANKHVKEAIKWIDENEQKVKEALRLKRIGEVGNASATASSQKTKKLEGNEDSDGSDHDNTEDYDSDNSEDKEDKIKNAVYHGWNDPTSNNIRTGAVIAPHCVDAAIKAAWTLKKWDYLSEAFSRGLLLGGAMSSIGLIEKLLEDDRLIDAVNVCTFAWWVNPEDLRRIVDACMSAKKNTSSSGLNFQSLHDKNLKVASRKVKLCEKLAREKRSGPKKKGISKEQRFYEELELRAAFDDCRIWTFAVEHFEAWVQPMHTIVARSMFHREDTSVTLKSLSNEDALEFLSFLLAWVEFHVITLRGEFNAKKDMAVEENVDEVKNNEESSRLDPDDEVNFDFGKKYRGIFPSLQQSIEWSSALLDVCLPAFSGNARAIEKMERLRELATRQFETNASIANLSGALEHVKIGADIPEGLGVTSAKYSIEKVNW